MRSDPRVKVVTLSPACRDELIRVINDPEHQCDLVIKDEKGENVCVITSPAMYEFYRHFQHTLEHPEEHRLKIRRFWDTGPGVTFEHIFREKPYSPLLKFRIWFYRKRLALYYRIGLRKSKPA